MALRIHIVVACVLSSVVAVPTQAGLLDLTLLDAPDIASGYIDVTYTASTDQFVADGWALTFDDDGVGPPINIDPPGSFNITATIDESGAPVEGTLEITGEVLTFGPTLLTGSLTDFGYMDGGGDIFEFVFTVTGGDLAIPAYYGEPGSVVGVILNANGSTFGGTFDVDFNNNYGIPGFGQGVSDTAPIAGAVGACCLPNGDCVEVPEADCTGDWLGEGTGCDPNPCPQPGACCMPDGSCTEVLEADCSGDWLGEGTDCDPNPCPQPGACCMPDGSCTEVLEADCAGEWLGEGTGCDPNPCPQPGACCMPDGSCTEVFEADCTGDWLGEGTDCDPNPCPQPTACCLPNGDCTEVLSEAECTGYWLGEGTDCDPNPCPSFCPLLGDMNRSGVVNGADIQGFVEAQLGEFDWCADLAEPFGILDMADTEAFVDLLLAP